MTQTFDTLVQKLDDSLKTMDFESGDHALSALLTHKFSERGAQKHTLTEAEIKDAIINISFALPDNWDLKPLRISKEPGSSLHLVVVAVTLYDAGEENSNFHRFELHNI